MNILHEIIVALSAILFGGAVAVGGGTGTLNQLDQWTGTTTPYVAITQASSTKPILIQGLTAGQNLCLDAQNRVTTTGCTSGGSGTPGGATTQVQFNDAGSFGGDPGLTYNKTTDTLSGTSTNFTNSTSSNLFATNASTTNLVISALRDTTSSLGTIGMVLQTNGSVATWVSTSSLNVGSTLTFGDALTLTGTDVDFDGGATPSGDLGGTWASPSVTDDSHAHTGTTLSAIDLSDDVNLTAGDALTLTADDIDFDGGTIPAGALGGTWASPTVDDDGHAHTGTTLSAIDVSNDINLTGGVGLTLTGDDMFCDTGSGSVFGCLLAADWLTFSAKLATTSIDTIAELESISGGSNIIISTEIDTLAELETLQGSINILSATEFDTCSEIAAIVGGETGTCGSLVLSADPTFTGKATFANASSSNLSSDYLAVGQSATTTISTAGALTTQAFRALGHSTLTTASTTNLSANYFAAGQSASTTISIAGALTTQALTALGHSTLTTASTTNLTANYLVVGQSASTTISTAGAITTPTINYSGMTAGSLIFATTSAGLLTQDNASLYFDDAKNHLGIGSTTPTSRLSVQGASGSASPVFSVASSSLQTMFSVLPTGTTTISGTTAATSSMYMYTTAAAKGGAIIIEDVDGAGCTEVSALNGVLSAKIVTCPTEI